MADYGDDRYLPEEIIFDEILSRIPAPIVVGFKRVSKLWRNTICSRSFAKIHLNKRRCCMPPGKLSIPYKLRKYGQRSSPPVLLSENRKFRCAADVLYPDNNHGGQVDLLHSCDGLILARIFTWERWERDFRRRSDIYIFNPVISYIIQIPPPPVYVNKAVLFVDDADDDKYKIVVWGGCKCRPAVHLFDFVGWCWKTFTIPIPFDRMEMVRFTKPVISKGCLYWPDNLGVGRSLIILDFTSGHTRVIKLWYGKHGSYNFQFRFLAIDGTFYGLQFHSKLGFEDWYIIWVLLPHHNFEWAIYHRHGDIKPTPHIYVHPSFDNFFTAPVSSVVTIPPAVLLHQFKLVDITYQIERHLGGIAHMDTLVSSEDMMTPDHPLNYPSIPC